MKPSIQTHIGFELRHHLRPPGVGLDVYFWREASLPVWETLKVDTVEINGLIEREWAFGQKDDGNLHWMSIKLPMVSADEAQWPAAYARFGGKLALLNNSVAAKLRDEVAAGTQG